VNFSHQKQNVKKFKTVNLGGNAWDYVEVYTQNKVWE